MEKKLQSDTKDSRLNEELVTVKNKLRGLQMKKIYGIRVRAKLNWLSYGDKGSKFFLRYIKTKTTREQVGNIWSDDKMINDPKVIKKLFHRFYKTLFSTEGENPQGHKARKVYKELIPKKITKGNTIPSYEKLCNALFAKERKNIILQCRPLGINKIK